MTPDHAELDADGDDRRYPLPPVCVLPVRRDADGTYVIATRPTTAKEPTP